MNKKNKNYSAKVFLRFSNPHYNNIVRTNTENIAKKMGFNEDQIYEIVMVVDEAYTNAVEHSQSTECNLQLEIEYTIYEDKLEIRVTDTGCGFNISKKEILTTLENNIKERGRGLSIIKCLSDEFEIYSSPGKGTTIKIVKYLPEKAALSMRQF